MSDPEVKTIIPFLPDPPGCDTYSPDVCWRCGGTGIVVISETEDTPCGACLGKQPPTPCPKCKSRRVKMCFDGTFYMHCRDCGDRGLSALSDLEAHALWQAHALLRNTNTDETSNT